MATKTLDDITADICARYLEERRENFYEFFENLSYGHQSWSPIETVMARALQYCLLSPEQIEGWGGFNEFMFGPFIRPFEVTDFSWQEKYGVIIYPQMPIGKYRADFVVNLKDERGCAVLGVIECDGHDFHERTKDQAKRDKVRDRYFQSLGLIVLRYTGSEIWADPIKCATDAIEILRDRAAASYRGRGDK